jgi:protein-disulfide isomerase
MSKKQDNEGKSKRQLLKEQRKRKEQQQRLFMIGGIVVVALLLVGLIAIPAIQNADTPVGEFNRITPVAYPNENGTTLGDPNAKVTIDTFEDFQCHACQSYTQSIEPVVIKNIVETGKAKYVFHQYPFLDDASTDTGSDNAANASECAAEQNRFWDYKNMLFANRNGVIGEFSSNRLAAFAESLGLDMNQFNTCYSENRYQDKINADLQLGKEMNVQGTPSVFVNGENVSPGKVPTFDQISALVDQKLSETGN